MVDKRIAVAFETAEKFAVVYPNVAPTFEIRYRGMQGIQGLKGDKGDKGETGDVGPAGPFWYSGSGDPSDALGEIYDWYLDTTTGIVSQKTSDTGFEDWAYRTTIKGPKGDTGSTGPTGATGRGITSIARTSGTGAPGTTDTFTITYSDATTSTFTVYNGANGATGATGPTGATGRGITSIARTSGTGAPGTTDTFTITYSDATTSTFTVYNGANGAGSIATVNGDAGPNVVLDAEDVGARPSTWVPTWGDVTGKPATFPPLTHNHDDRYYTETESDDRFLQIANLPIASETVQGIVERATDAEATAGLDMVRYISPKQLKDAITALLGGATPANLDTLYEIAAAINNDANLYTTLTNQISTKQPLDADLTQIASLASAANKLLYATGPQAWALTDFTAFARQLLDDADAAAMRGTLGLGNVDNTADTAKPVSTAQQAALDAKVPTTRTVASGTGLTGGGDLSADRTLAVAYGTTAGTAAQGNDSRITGAVQNGGGAATLRVLTQAAYNAIGTKDANTVYVVVG